MAGHPGLYGDLGEARSWVSARRNVFELAPHRIADNSSNFDHQSVLVGKYFSTAWYQTQLTINAGARQGFVLGPVDWNYQPNHVYGLIRNGGPGHPLRFIASHIKMYQFQTDGKTIPENSTFGVRQALPWRYLPDDPMFADMSPELRATALGGLISMFVDSMSRHDPSEWERAEERGDALSPESEIPRDWARNRFNAECHVGDSLSCTYNAIEYFREAGVSENVLDNLIDWSEILWPAANWDAVRN